MIKNNLPRKTYSRTDYLMFGWTGVMQEHVVDQGPLLQAV